MIGPERSLADLERALVERLGLGVVAVGRYSTARLLSAAGDVRVLGAEGLLLIVERALIERFGLGVVAHGPVEQRQVVERRRAVRGARGRGSSRGCRARAGRAARRWRSRRLVSIEQREVAEEVAVSGWSGPSAFSRIASAR